MALPPPRAGNLERLAMYLDQGDDAIAASLLDLEARGQLMQLHKVGALKPIASTAPLICPACETFPARIVGPGEAQCPACGQVSGQPEDRLRLRPDAAWVRKRIAQALGIVGFAHQVIIAGRVWWLGDVGRGCQSRRVLSGLRLGAVDVQRELHAVWTALSVPRPGALEQAAQRGNKAAIAQRQELADAGVDWNRIVQASGNLQAFRVRQVSGKLYSEVERLAAGTGNLPVPRATQSITKALKEATNAKLTDQPTIKLLEQLKAAVTPAPGKTVDNSYSALRRLRSDLGDLVQDYYRSSNAITGSKGVGILQCLREAVESDMDAFAQRSGNRALTNAWRRADRFYRDRVVPYKDRQLASAMKDAHADEVYGKFIQTGKASARGTSTTPWTAKGRPRCATGWWQTQWRRRSTTRVRCSARPSLRGRWRKWATRRAWCSAARRSRRSKASPS